MKNVVVKENHLTFGGVAYFRAHAEEVEIGSIGEKRKPLFKQNYLEVKDRLIIPDGNIVKATEAEIDFTHTSKKAFKLDFVSATGEEGLSPGDTIPNIKGKDIDGITFQLNDYKGKVIMLDFWGDW